MTLDELKEAVTSRSIRTFRGALARLDELSPAALERLAEGLQVTDYGTIKIKSYGGWVPRNVSSGRRGVVCMAALRATGALDGRESLALPSDLKTTDLSPLEGLTGLQSLSLMGQTSLKKLGPLASLTGLTKLKISGVKGLTDLSPIAELTGLTELVIDEADRLIDLSPLADLTGLQSLEVDGARNLTDLSPLTGLSGLTLLSVDHCATSADLSPIAALTGLETLSLHGRGARSDLSPLAALAALTDLSLDGSKDVDVSPLAPLTGLTRLSISSSWTPRGMEALAGLSGLAPENVTYLWGDQYLLASYIDGHHLGELEELNLSSRSSVANLDGLARYSALKRLRLRGCARLEDTWALIGMDALESLDLSQTTVQPRPPRAIMEGRGELDAYRRKLARALSQKAQRTEREQRWLDAAAARGLTGRKKSSAAERARKAQIKQLRRLIATGEPAQVQQGYDIAEALGDPELIAELARGVSLGDDGAIQITEGASRKGHLRRRPTRLLSALHLLRISGQLEGVRRLRIPKEFDPSEFSWLSAAPGVTELSLESCEGLSSLRALAPLAEMEGLEIARGRFWNWAPLGELTGLRSLAIAYTDVDDLDWLPRLRALESLSFKSVYRIRDFSALQSLPALRSLSLESAGWVRSLDQIAPLTGLRSLRLLKYRDLRDLSILTDLTAIEVLQITEARRVTDLSPLAGMTGLTSLNLSGAHELSDLSPLAGLTGLRSLSLTGCREVEDLSPLAGLTELESLSLYGVSVEQPLRNFWSGREKIAEILSGTAPTGG